MTGVSAGGDLLPFQCMWQGNTPAVLPKPTAPGYEEANALGFLFEFTHTSTYWSTEATMKSYVKNTLIPHFHHYKEKLGLPQCQCCVWQLDVWSVHISVSFREWMATEYPWIILDYVPPGCTGLFQPCDVGMQ